MKRNRHYKTGNKFKSHFVNTCNRFPRDCFYLYKNIFSNTANSTETRPDSAQILALYNHLLTYLLTYLLFP